MRYRSSKEIESLDEITIEAENGRLANGKQAKSDNMDEQPTTTDILNPFVHHLELETTYDKLKVSIFAPFFFISALYFVELWSTFFRLHRRKR